jgi:transposase
VGWAVLFWDETGHSFLARLGTTWAPTGHPPVLKRTSQRREVSTIAALVAPLGAARNGADVHPRLFARHFRGGIHGEQVIATLRYFRWRLGCPLIVAWDRLPAHRATLVLAFVAAHPDDYRIEWLPPYAPELNPEELCTWGNGAVKRDLQSAAPASVDELHQLARRGFRRLGRRPDLLHGFFRHVGLSVK